MLKTTRAVVGLVVVAALLVAGAVWPATPVLANEVAGVQRGSLAGAPYQIEVPAAWNGTLLLYSHGYQKVGTTPHAIDAPSPTIAHWLVDHGYALAGSAYARQGWAVADALKAQTALLAYFRAHHAGLRRTLLWGSSMGGLITETLAERDPKGIQGALTLCAPLAGGVGEWNARLDAAFAFKTLLAPGSPLALTGIAHPTLNLALAQTMLSAAQATAAGRARIALVAAVGEIPGWVRGQAAPAVGSGAIEQAQFHELHATDAGFMFALRANLEARAGGNPSWNTGVDYGALLARSGQDAEVRALYAQSGMSLDQDLGRLASAKRIGARATATSYLARYASPTGELGVPVLALHTVGDTLVPAAEERAFAATVSREHRSSMLRQEYVARGGHCTFTASEQVIGVELLEQRVQTGSWPSAGVDELRARGATLGLGETRFTAATPPAFTRPYVPSGRARG